MAMRATVVCARRCARPPGAGRLGKPGRESRTRWHDAPTVRRPGGSRRVAALEDGVVALLRYTLDLRQGGTMPDAAKLDAQLERMMRGWVPAVEAARSK